MVELRMRTSKSLLNFFGKLHRQWKTIPRKTRWRTMYAKKSVGWTFLVCVCVSVWFFFIVSSSCCGNVYEIWLKSRACLQSFFHRIATDISHFISCPFNWYGLSNTRIYINVAYSDLTYRIWWEPMCLFIFIQWSPASEHKENAWLGQWRY